jgi:hypothetical protein
VREKVELPLENFRDFNEKIFHDKNIPLDTYNPITNPQT